MRKHQEVKMNLARIKLLSRLVVAMCIVRHVGLHKLAMSFGTKAMSLSCMQRTASIIGRVADGEKWEQQQLKRLHSGKHAVVAFLVAKVATLTQMLSRRSF